jgi:hypothetical protein
MRKWKYIREIFKIKKRKKKKEKEKTIKNKNIFWGLILGVP